MSNSYNLKKLSEILDGEIYDDNISKTIYATDASAYREMPLGVVFPKSSSDIEKIVRFAVENKMSIIPRGAGTSLAGQVVGSGLVVDISRHCNHIIEINEKEHWVKVEPGVVLAELNNALKPVGLQFGPETSTANRCTVGGMLGNNSCGLHSLVYGSVRDHVIEVEAILSDGSKALFKPLTAAEFEEKLKLSTFEASLYRNVYNILSDSLVRDEIVQQYPDKSLPRRNNGYALDQLANMQPFNADGPLFNFAKILAGSEGTLAFTTSIKLNLLPLPPKHKALVCVHLDSLKDAFLANIIALKYNPSAVELMDKTILELTKGNIGLARNRFFISGEPVALLIIELWGRDENEIKDIAQQIETEMRANGYGYHFPLVWGDDIPKVWNLRKAGLGVLSNMPGDAKSVAVVEDTAIPVNSLFDYLSDFAELLKSLNLEAVYHGHIATGELHLRPVLNLKKVEDVAKFKKVAVETARLVKKYRGSLSGEHGDGRLRGEFIPFMLGEKVYGLLKELKHTWDPNGILNPGKIIETPPMNQSLRFEPGQDTLQLNSYFDYTIEMGYMRAIERCNGAGDCRKSAVIGGTMCPSFMATREERNSTRGRANVLREMISASHGINWANNVDIASVLDTCLSCKACKAECPSGIDMTKLKAEFLQNHYDSSVVPLETRLVANYPAIMKALSKMPRVANFMLQSSLMGGLTKKVLNFAPERRFPMLSDQNFSKWMNQKVCSSAKNGKVYLFNDEFLDSVDSHIGIKAVQLLERLGYEVVIPKHLQSGRTYISKGLIKKAGAIARKNVSMLKDIVSSDTPLVGIEPSAILTFRDEYITLVPDDMRQSAKQLASNVFMFDEFIMREVKKGKINGDMFSDKPCVVKLHGHCHQKALTTTAASKQMLSLPVNYQVDEIPSGCCGMAGAFGYEKRHYELSMKIGEMVLFPAVRAAAEDVVIAAPGTSCREQIFHGTGRTALHPIEVLYNALL